MKMALYDFVLRKKGIYGILHIVILLLSLFLIISISIDTFKGIPFYTQSVYMKVQLWICVLFLVDFVLEFILADNKKRYFTTHYIPAGCHSLSEYHSLYGVDVLTRSYLYVTFYPSGTWRICAGYCSGVVYLQQGFRAFCILFDDVAGYRLFCQSRFFHY